MRGRSTAADEYDGVFSPETVDALVRDSIERLGTITVTTHLPVLTERFARHRLQADEFPKPLTDEVVRAADVVVAMGCGEACPVLAGPRYLSWAVADPAGQDLAAVRRIRHDISNHVLDLLKELLP